MELTTSSNDKPQLSDKQLNYITKLATNLDIELSEFIKTYLKRDTSTLHNLTNFETSKLIKKLQSMQSLSMGQYLKLQTSYSLKELSSIFRQEFPTWADVKIYHYDKLTQLKFHNKYKDHPLLVNVDYEYGWQDSPLCADNKMYYIKLFDVCTLDIDDISYEELTTKLSEYLNVMTFMIYATHKGFHVYIVSELINYGKSKQLMTDLGCDFWYVQYCSNNGYKIRLNAKINRNEEFTEKYLTTIGHKPVMPCIKELIDVKDSYVKHHTKCKV